MRQSRIAARHGSGSRKEQRVGWERGSGYSLSQDRKDSHVSHNELLNLSQQLTHFRWVPLLMDNLLMNSCLTCSICFFAPNSSQFFDLLTMSCMIPMEESASQCQLISLCLICSSACLLWLKSLRFNFLIEVMKSDDRISLFPSFRFHFCLSILQFLLSHFLTASGHFSFPLKEFVNR